MSPEQARGGKLDFRSDIYSLGCVAFEIFTGRAPFKGETPVATLYKHVNEEPPLLDADLPSALLPILRKALAKKPDDRFSTVEAFSTAVRLAQSGLDPDGSTTRPYLMPSDEPAAAVTPPALPTGASVDTFTLAREWRTEAGEAERLKGSSLSSRRLFWASGLLLVAAAAFALRGLDRRDSVPASVTSPQAPPSVAPASVPASLTTARGEDASPAPSLEPRHAPVPVPGIETPARSLDVEPSPHAAGSGTPAPRASAPPEANQGTLTLLVVPASEVTLDGVSLGTFSLREIPLDAGGHTLRILHPDYEPLQRKVQIRAGENQRLVLDLAEKGIPQVP